MNTNRVRRAFWVSLLTWVAISAGCQPGMNPAATGGRDPLPAVTPAGAPNTLARWRKNNLTFFINNFTTKTTQAKQIQMITDAFNRWGAVTPLNFTRVLDRAGADFSVGFGTGGHCELYVSSMLTCPTDAAFAANTLGHAYFPEGQNMGQCHMNDAQDWSNDRLLFSTLVHELGHGIGLDHLPEANSVMFASDNGQTGDLQPPDIAAAQRLYGSRDGTVRPAMRTAPPATDTAANRTAPTTTLPDTDGDGIDDASELYIYGTNPESRDTDGDGVDDGVEIMLGLNPRDRDTDHDGKSDGDELNGDGNAFIPDFGMTGDAAAFIGRYVGSDSLGTPLEFTVAVDGSVTGKLSLKLFGFDDDEALIGHCGTSGAMEVVTYDYFLEYKGTITGTVVGDGTFTSEDGKSGMWTATKTPKLKLTDAQASLFKVADDGHGGVTLTPTRRTDMAAYAR